MTDNIPLSRRIALVALVVAIQMVYFPTSQNGTGGVMPKLPLDVFPVYPVWVVVYVLCFPLWLFCISWVVAKMERRLFREFIAGALFTVSIGIGIFILFPTYVELPDIAGTDVFSELLRQIQVSGGQYDALPSAHLYTTTLCALFFSRGYPRTRLMWVLIVVMVGLSTLFTGQHYILDVLSGMALAWLGYVFGLWWVRRRQEQAADG